MSFKFSNLTNVIVRQFSNSVINLKKNHYDCLQITPKATQGDIKSAYYKLSKQYHPDLNKDNESAASMFRDITEAYEVLSNVRSRKLYDRGMSVRGNVDDFDTSEVLVKDDIKHASFYRHWNKPASRKTSTGKTTVYDIDEWTKAHYSDTFNQSFSKKQSDVEFIREKSQTRDENSTHLQAIGVIVILIGFILFQSSSPRSNFDDRENNTSASEYKPELDTK